MKNKIKLILAASLLSFAAASAQTGGVGVGTTTPDASSALDVTSTTKGFLMPRMTTAQRTAIATPAAGLQVFDTDTTSTWLYNGTVWVQSATGTQDLRMLSNNNHVSADAGVGSNGTSLGTGVDNIAIGKDAMSSNTTGNTNTAIGHESLKLNTTGTGNTAVGATTLKNNSTGNNNTAVGQDALFNATTGSGNTAVGRGAMVLNTTGEYNTALGGAALFSNSTGLRNIAVGSSALFSSTTANSNIAIGVESLTTNTTGEKNIAIGDSALLSNTTGNTNTAIGHESLKLNTTGTGNTAVGATTLKNNSTGNNNTAVGQDALFNATTGSGNTAVGRGAMVLNTTGEYNTALGGGALFSNSTGLRNIAVGSSALFSSTTANSNIAIGVESLTTNTIGTKNIAIGDGALNSNISGSENTVLGANSGANILGSDNITIGINTNVLNSSGNNQLNIGNWIYGDNGNISVGVTSMLSKFNVGGGIETTTLLNATNNYGIGFSLSDNFIYNAVKVPHFGMSFALGSSSAKTYLSGAEGIQLFTAGLPVATINQSGNMGVGTTTPSVKLEVNGAIKVGDDAGTATPSAGMIKFNSSTSKFQGYDGSAWVDLN